MKVRTLSVVDQLRILAHLHPIPILGIPVLIAFAWLLYVTHKPAWYEHGAVISVGAVLPAARHFPQGWLCNVQISTCEVLASLCIGAARPIMGSEVSVFEGRIFTRGRPVTWAKPYYPTLPAEIEAAERYRAVDCLHN